MQNPKRETPRGLAGTVQVSAGESPTLSNGSGARSDDELSGVLALGCLARCGAHWGTAPRRGDRSTDISTGATRVFSARGEEREPPPHGLYAQVCTTPIPVPDGGGDGGENKSLGRANRWKSYRATIEWMKRIESHARYRILRRG
jgi:hypothetical protein